MVTNYIHIDATLCKTKEELFNTFKKILNFPDYFSHNWDSFEEIINDLEIDYHTAVIISNYKSLLMDNKEDKTIFKEIIENANAENVYKFYKIQLL
jgi:RNAse (barnase) inhibitor barstar